MAEFTVHTHNVDKNCRKNESESNDRDGWGWFTFKLATGDEITVYSNESDQRFTKRALAELFAEPLKQIEQEEMALAHEEECKRVIDSAYAETPEQK